MRKLILLFSVLFCLTVSAQVPKENVFLRVKIDTLRTIKRMTACGITYPTTDGSSGWIMKTDGSGVATFVNSLSIIDTLNYIATKSDLDSMPIGNVLYLQDSLNDRYRRKDTSDVLLSKTRYSHDTANIAFLNQQNTFTKPNYFNDTIFGTTRATYLKIKGNSDAVFHSSGAGNGLLLEANGNIWLYAGTQWGQRHYVGYDGAGFYPGGTTHSQDMGSLYYTWRNVFTRKLMSDTVNANKVFARSIPIIATPDSTLYIEDGEIKRGLSPTISTFYPGLQDTINRHTDTLQAHNIRINNIKDSLFWSHNAYGRVFPKTISDTVFQAVSTYNTRASEYIYNQAGEGNSFRIVADSGRNYLQLADDPGAYTYQLFAGLDGQSAHSSFVGSGVLGSVYSRITANGSNYDVSHYFDTAGYYMTGTGKKNIGRTGATIDTVKTDHLKTAFATGTGTVIVADGSGNLLNSTSAYVTGTGVTNYLSRWTGTNTIDSSGILMSGKNATLAGTLTVSGKYIYGDNANPNIRLDNSWGAGIFYSTTGIKIDGGIKFEQNGALRWKFDPTTYNLVPQDNNSYDIGIASTNVVRAVYATNLYSAAVQLTTGASAGHILQSDASGNASWVAPSTIADLNWIRDAVNGYVYTRTSSDNVGIGIGTPAKTLHVQDVAGNVGTIQLGSATYYGTIQHDGTTTGANIYNVAAASGGGHKFQIGGTDKVVVDVNGKVGIGTSTPYYTTDIAGDLRIQGVGALRFNGTGSGDALQSITGDANGIHATGNLNLAVTAYTYIGDASTDGSWRFFINANGDLEWDCRVSGSWVSKMIIKK